MQSSIRLALQSVFCCEPTTGLQAQTAAQTCQVDTYTQAGQIPAQVLQTLNITNSAYLHPAYLQALQQHNRQRVQFQYWVFRHGKQVLGLALAQQVTVDLESEIAPDEHSPLLAKLTLRTLRKMSRGGKFRILVLGNVFQSGEQAVWLAQPAFAEKVRTALMAQLQTVQRNRSFGSKAQVVLYKDLYAPSPQQEAEFRAASFHKVCFEPTMILELSPEWNTLTDYLQSLKSKYRVKANKALKESSALRTEHLTPSRVQQLLPQLTELYENVEGKAFSMGRITLQTYATLLETLPEAFTLRAYWLGDVLVGFMGALRNGTDLDAQYVGLNYDYNRTHYVYQRMLYDYVEIALHNQLKRVVFGRTVGEIKSTLGAEPHNLYCYLRYEGRILNRMLRPIIRERLSEPKPFHQIRPFKHQTEPEPPTEA
jgi:hypothetical protein